VTSTDLATTHETPTPHAVSRWTLAALVVGSMVGAGVFSLPASFATDTGVTGALIAWAIAGTGMLMLALTFQRLARERPDLDAGVYAYARAGFGRYAGFLSALGYWASAAVGNVAYWVLIMSTLGTWVPALKGGATPTAIACASVGLWLFHLLLVRGVTSATAVNRIVTVAKLVPLAVFLVVVALAFDPTVFVDNLSGGSDGLFDQVRATMLLTVFVFIGVEGASVYSRYARRRADVGWATVSGFLTVLAVFVLVTMVSYGVLPRAELAALDQPSVAGVLEHVVGRWGSAFVGVGLLVSVLGAYLAWTLMACEVVREAARDGDMPAALARENRRDAPVGAIVATNVVVQVFLVVVLFSADAFDAAVSLCSSLVLVPYLLSAGFSTRLVTARPRRAGAVVVSVVAVVYTVFLVWAGGPSYLLLTALVYGPGSLLYVWARRSDERAFTAAERVVLAVVLGAAAVAIAFLVTGRIAL